MPLDDATEENMKKLIKAGADLLTKPMVRVRFEDMPWSWQSTPEETTNALRQNA